MSKYDLAIAPPLMNAAGSLGFTPTPHGPLDLTDLGAFVTNPISLLSRSPALARGCLNFPGGFLLHSGYPNPGLSAAIRRYAARWARSITPIIVHLLPQGERSDREPDLPEMVSRLESVEGVMGIELGLPPDCSPALARQLTTAASGELPLIVRLPLERAGELAEALRSASISALSLGPARGALLGPGGRLTRGRLYGPGLFPQALEVVRGISELGLPVIGAGGVYAMRQVEAMLSAGAIAVQVDAVFWRLGWDKFVSG
jgi:dihydroorotate dehydrogenase